jgi:pSer/pThr/pTyr-binding forkhead associated (FHA) protein
VAKRYGVSLPKKVRCEAPPMRDASTLQQRRRRLRLLQNDDFKAEAGSSVSGPPAPVDAEESRRQLFEDCAGQSGLQLLIEVKGEAHARKVSLNRPYLLIGSDSQCDVRIKQPSVLPYHVYVQWIDGRLFCWGLGDVQPPATWVGPKPVALGPFRVSVPDVDLANGQQDPQSRSSELAEEVSQIQLKFAGVEQSDNLWPVDRRLTLIGRGAQCKLRLDHPEIPIVLAALVRTNRTCWLVDLQHSDRLQVNDQYIDSLQALDVGDKLRLGEFQAEVTAASFTAEPTVAESTKSPSVPKITSVRELADQHRTHLETLSESLETVQYYLDTDHLDGLPELKTAIQQYVLHAQRHHRETQAALESLAEIPELAK